MSWSLLSKKQENNSDLFGCGHQSGIRCLYDEELKGLATAVLDDHLLVEGDRDYIAGGELGKGPVVEREAQLPAHYNLVNIRVRHVGGNYSSRRYDNVVDVDRVVIDDLLHDEGAALFGGVGIFPVCHGLNIREGGCIDKPLPPVSRRFQQLYDINTHDI